MVNYIPHSLIQEFVSHLKSQSKSDFTVVAYKKDLEQFVGFLTTKDKTDILKLKKMILTAFRQAFSRTATRKSRPPASQFDPHVFSGYLKNSR
jgi:integrase/recombinase XerC/integrase/recombinase XerD